MAEGGGIRAADQDTWVLGGRSDRWRGIQRCCAGGEKLLLDKVQAIDGAAIFTDDESETMFAGAECRQWQCQVRPLAKRGDDELAEWLVVQRVPERVIALRGRFDADAQLGVGGGRSREGEYCGGRDGAGIIDTGGMDEGDVGAAGRVGGGNALGVAAELGVFGFEARCG